MFQTSSWSPLEFLCQSERQVQEFFHTVLDRRCTAKAKTNEDLIRPVWQSLWGIVAHSRCECTYLGASVDQHGERLTSQHRYESVIRPNEVPNEIGRWAIPKNTGGVKPAADDTLRVAIEA